MKLRPILDLFFPLLAFTGAVAAFGALSAHDAGLVPRYVSQIGAGIGLVTTILSPIGALLVFEAAERNRIEHDAN